jgi:hypothetical protein
MNHMIDMDHMIAHVLRYTDPRCQNASTVFRCQNASRYLGTSNTHDLKALKTPRRCTPPRTSPSAACPTAESQALQTDNNEVSQTLQTDNNEVSQTLQTDNNEVSQALQTDNNEVSQALQTDNYGVFFQGAGRAGGVDNLDSRMHSGPKATAM